MPAYNVKAEPYYSNIPYNIKAVNCLSLIHISTRNSNGNMRKKQSEYASQLKEKQKVKFIYGVLEKQFHNAYLRAEARPGKTGENLLQIMECLSLIHI